MKLQIPGRGLDDDYVCSLLTVGTNVWCGASDGTIHIFNTQVRVLSEEQCFRMPSLSFLS